MVMVIRLVERFRMVLLISRLVQLSQELPIKNYHITFGDQISTSWYDLKCVEDHTVIIGDVENVDGS